MSDTALQSRLDALAPLAVLRLGQILISPHAERRHRLTALWCCFGSQSGETARVERKPGKLWVRVDVYHC